MKNARRGVAVRELHLKIQTKATAVAAGDSAWRAGRTVGVCQNRAGIARARQDIGEAELRIAELTTERVNEAAERLRDVQTEILDLEERIRTAADVLRRTEVREPRGGVVVGLSVHTPGGVIGPGQPLLDIVPSDDRLIVEAQVDPQDVEAVHAGLEAEVRLTAFTSRFTTPVAGRVIGVSADRLEDERTGRPYYLARVELTQDPAAVYGDAPIQPGMPAEMMILTGARTALDYLMGPLEVGLNRAFRED